MLNFLFETFRLGIKNLRLHKLRSLLTALGIIFGVAAVIIMVAIGEGSKRAALEQVEQLGARNILLRSVPPPESQQASQRTQRVLDYGLKRLDLRRVSTLPGVANIVPLRNTELNIIRGCFSRAVEWGRTSSSRAPNLTALPFRLGSIWPTSWICQL